MPPHATETRRRPIPKVNPASPAIPRALRLVAAAAALSAISWSSANAGAKFIDIGCMQINHHFHAARFRSLDDMFDPERNVRYAASLLKTLRTQEGTWTMAVARYNAGPNNPKAQRAYIGAVISHRVASGAGAWTPNARAFCG